MNANSRFNKVSPQTSSYKMPTPGGFKFGGGKKFKLLSPVRERSMNGFKTSLGTGGEPGSMVGRTARFASRAAASPRRTH